MLLANLLIARVMLSLRFINEKLESKHRISIYFFMCGGFLFKIFEHESLIRSTM